MAKEKNSTHALRKLCASVEDVRRQFELFLTEDQTSIDRIKTDLRDGFAAISTQSQKVTIELLKQRDLGIKKSIYLNVSVVNEILQALKTELSQLEPSLNPVY